MNAKPVVLVARRLPEAVEARLHRDYIARLNTVDEVYSTRRLLELAEGAQAMIPCHTEKLSAETIRQLPNSIRAICSFSVGYDHIDLDAAKTRGIVVTNTPEVLSNATAEIAMLLLLGAARRAHEGARQIREAVWSDWSATFQLGLEVTGKRLGIVGMGRVGRILAKRARGFDMEIHYHNRHRLHPQDEAGAIYHPNLREMVPHCQFLSINCPATAQTRHLVDAELLALLPDDAILVNTSRGAVVDDDALIAALRCGKLFAAGLDVFNDEPNIDPRYKTLDNTFLLPHVGSATRETRDAMGFRVLDNLDAIMAGREPRDRLA